MSKELADLMFPNIDKTPEYYEELYPKRNLPEGAMVTRFAPSPTGFIHIGSLFGANLDRRLADQSNGVCYLRIEDTDGKREIDDGINVIINGLKVFGIEFDEGAVSESEEKGSYGPYIQSRRKDIYQCYAKSLVERGLAYPCFCTPEELDAIRERQEKLKIVPGYYGEFATCRKLSVSQMIERVKNGEPYVVRLKSPGSMSKKIRFKDAVRGVIEFPENVQDIVIIKSDGLPTYHFAHAIDDHLMRTTHVIRGEEWVSSIPLHVQLFEVLGFEMPEYIHTPTIMKDDEGSKRKISKRKDPEAAASYYKDNGIPKEAVIDYLMNILNSNFENWRKENPLAPLSEFKVDPHKISSSGALLDLVKLADVSKNTIATFSAQRVYEEGLAWAEEFDTELAGLMKRYPDYTKGILNIERTGTKVRKDISKWADLRDNLEYLYDEVFFTKEHEDEWQKITEASEIKEILKAYLEVFDENDDKDTWFAKMKDVSEKFGYAREVKDFKKNPDSYKGHVGDISTVIRVALTGRRNTPDLYEILKLMGRERAEKRFARLED
ncbi:MAG: glutamate--tRNA ligase [Clostridia bacterium]|nr:glutamate--tRNA ligase [Clostridia bacterium]